MKPTKEDIAFVFSRNMLIEAHPSFNEEQIDFIYDTLVANFKSTIEYDIEGLICRVQEEDFDPNEPY